MTNPFSPEEIAAARAAINAKPPDAVLMPADMDTADGSGHRINKGDLAWRSRGAPRWDGPPDATSMTSRMDHWLCRNCARRKGWEA